MGLALRVFVDLRFPDASENRVVPIQRLGFEPIFNVRRRAASVAPGSERSQLEWVLDDDIQPVDVIAALAAVGAMGDMGQLQRQVLGRA